MKHLTSLNALFLLFSISLFATEESPKFTKEFKNIQGTFLIHCLNHWYAPTPNSKIHLSPSAYHLLRKSLLSINFQNVSWEQAIHILCKTYNLHYKQTTQKKILITLPNPNQKPILSLASNYPYVSINDNNSIQELVRLVKAVQNQTEILVNKKLKKKIQIRLWNVHWKTALELIAKKANATIENIYPSLLEIKPIPKVSAEFANANLRIALLLLAKQAGISLILSNQVQGKLNLHWNDLPILQALQIIAKINKLKVIPIAPKFYAILSQKEWKKIQPTLATKHTKLLPLPKKESPRQWLSSTNPTLAQICQLLAQKTKNYLLLQNNPNQKISLPTTYLTLQNLLHFALSQTNSEIRKIKPQLYEIRKTSKIYANLENFPLKKAIQILANIQGLNLIFPPHLPGNITAYLNGVKSQTLLYTISRLNGYEISQEKGKILRLYPITTKLPPQKTIPTTLTPNYQIQLKNGRILQGETSLKWIKKITLQPYQPSKIPLYPLGKDNKSNVFFLPTESIQKIYFKSKKIWKNPSSSTTLSNNLPTIVFSPSIDKNLAVPTFSLNAQQTLHHIVQKLSKIALQAGHNLLASRLKYRKINLRMKNVPWQHALSILAYTAGCKVKKISANVSRIHEKTKVNMEFENTPVNIILELLAKMISKNIIVNLPEYGQQPLSLTFYQTSWPDALQAICKQLHLQWKEEGENAILIQRIPNSQKRSKKNSYKIELQNKTLKQLLQRIQSLEKMYTYQKSQKQRPSPYLSKLQTQLKQLSQKTKNSLQSLQKIFQKNNLQLQQIKKQITQLKPKTPKQKPRKLKSNTSPSTTLSNFLKNYLNYTYIQINQLANQPTLTSKEYVRLFQLWQRWKWLRHKAIAQRLHPSLRQLLAYQETQLRKLDNVLLNTCKKYAQFLLNHPYKNTYKRWNELCKLLLEMKSHPSPKYQKEAIRLFNRVYSISYLKYLLRLRPKKLNLPPFQYSYPSELQLLPSLPFARNKSKISRLFLAISEASLILSYCHFEGTSLPIRPSWYATKNTIQLRGLFVDFLSFLNHWETSYPFTTITSLNIQKIKDSRYVKIQMEFLSYYYRPFYEKKYWKTKLYQVLLNEAIQASNSPPSSPLWKLIQNTKYLLSTPTKQQLKEKMRLHLLRKWKANLPLLEKIYRRSHPYQSAVKILNSPHWYPKLLHISKSLDRKTWLTSLSIRYSIFKKQGILTLTGRSTTAIEVLYQKLLSYTSFQPMNLYTKSTFLDSERKTLNTFRFQLYLKKISPP
ncbi:MAG: hypothetical protein D6805_00530 [Planctomycetota bacterium]|nr:MAG: hypothetical protein D6805_00530 [Planctomycetota bacterium]